MCLFDGGRGYTEQVRGANSGQDGACISAAFTQNLEAHV